MPEGGIYLLLMHGFIKMICQITSAINENTALAIEEGRIKPLTGVKKWRDKNRPDKHKHRARRAV